jgi:hypothetical protein
MAQNPDTKKPVAEILGALRNGVLEKNREDKIVSERINKVIVELRGGKRTFLNNILKETLIGLDIF